MKDIQLYYDYWQHQAENHTLLQHSEAAGSRVFQVIGIEEALGDFRSGVKKQDFIFRLIKYYYTVGQPDHRITKTLNGGFIIAKWYNEQTGGKEAKFAAEVAAEQVMDQMIEKMIADSKNGHPLFDHSIDSPENFHIQTVEQGGDGNYVGWMLIYEAEQLFSNCTNPDPANWLDGGLTPLPA
ncbi:MAG: hypothetical protein AAFO02_00590 [Bacteroidota bacterium]